MKKIGIVSYNIYCSFTNYGSALQSWALQTAIKQRGGGGYFEPVLIDYCPNALLDADPLDPFKKMWDKDEGSRRMVEFSMPAIRENFYKFDRFYRERFARTKAKYTSQNFEEVSKDEGILRFVCGSDTIFCPDEFGFDGGYYADYPNMRGNSVAYAASFGEPTLTEEVYGNIKRYITNFKAIGLREKQMIPYVSFCVSVPLKQVIDPTLLLTSEDYDRIVSPRLVREKYLLLYSRRYNKAMYDFADDLAAKNGWEIVDISLRMDHAERHRMFYEAGVEEFLSLVKNAEFVVTNSYHGAIFSIQYRKPFYVFLREQCGIKIPELLEALGLSERLLIGDALNRDLPVDYDEVHRKLADARKDSVAFLRDELMLLVE